MSIARAFARFAAFCVCTVFFSSCFLFGPGRYTIDVTADQANDFDALYVVVAEDAKLPRNLGPDECQTVIDPENHSKYEAVLQFQPIPPSDGKGWAWGARHEPLETKSVAFSTNKGRVRVQIDKGLLEIRNALRVVLISLHRREGFSSKEISAGQLEEGEGAKFRLITSGLKLDGNY